MAAPPAKPAGKPVIAWALYDWANSAFATTVVAGFFPVFFKQFYSAGTDSGTSTLRLGVANSMASLVLAFAGPVLGAMADRSGWRKRFLAAFAVLGILSTGGLALAHRGQWQLGALLFVLGNLGFLGANVFYDGLLVEVATQERRDRVSALGYGLGYLGGGLLFAVQVLAVSRPALFGLADAASAIRMSFASVALWWAVFSLPLLAWVPEHASNAPLRGHLRSALSRLYQTYREARRLRVLWLFLLAYWLYIDAVDTVIRMSVDYGLSIGLESKHLLFALLLTQFVGFPAAVVFGRLGERVGAKRAILMGILVYVGVILGAAWMRSHRTFFVLALVIGLVQGGVQALSRSLYSRLIPPRGAAEFFGFFNLLGKAAAILGPLLMGVVSHWTGRPRLSILVLLVLLVGGAGLLLRVDEAEGARRAGELDQAW
jgi:UMF1 family MFS transporter